MKIRAIETEFDGVMYRSRLEAQTALFLKKLHLKYLYEPHVIDLGDGVNYVPDFYLPDIDTYIEVKGGHNERLDKWEKFVKLRTTDKKKEIWGALSKKEKIHTIIHNAYALFGEKFLKTEIPTEMLLTGFEYVWVEEFINAQNLLIKETGIVPPEHVDIVLSRCFECHALHFMDITNAWYCCVCGEHYKPWDNQSINELNELFRQCRNSSARYDRGIQ